VAVERIETLKDKMGQIVTVEFGEAFQVDDFQIPGVSQAVVKGRTLSLHVTGNHDRMLKAISQYKIEKFLAEEYTLENMFLEYYQNNHEKNQ